MGLAAVRGVQVPAAVWTAVLGLLTALIAIAYYWLDDGGVIERDYRIVRLTEICLRRHPATQVREVGGYGILAEPVAPEYSGFNQSQIGVNVSPYSGLAPQLDTTWQWYQARVHNPTGIGWLVRVGTDPDRDSLAAPIDIAREYLERTYPDTDALIHTANWLFEFRELNFQGCPS